MLPNSILSAFTPQPKVVAFVHVYYAEMWDEVKKYLGNLPAATRVIITVPNTKPILASRIQNEMAYATTLMVDNNGRDIGPFLAALKLASQSGFEVGCKIHTKLGQTEPHVWRRLMYDALIGNTARTVAIIEAFDAHPQLALVGPDKFFLNGNTFIGGNRQKLLQLANSLFDNSEVERAMSTGWGFFAGTMFWFRLKFLSPLLDADINFENRNDQNDGQMAHALERLFGLIPAIEDLKIGLVDTTSASNLVTVCSAGTCTNETELADYLPTRRYAMAARWADLRRDRRRDWRRPNRDLGVTFVGPVEARHGLGVSARGFADGLVLSGAPVHITPWRPGFDRVKFSPVVYPDIGEDQPITVVHLNLDLLTEARLLDLEPLRTMTSLDRFSVAIIYWELMAIPYEWVETLERFDEIWVTSEFMKRAVKAIFRRPVHLVRPLLIKSNFRRTEPSHALSAPTEKFLFFYSADIGSVAARKNPLAFWQAYREEFNENEGAGCVLKLHYLDQNNPIVDEFERIGSRRADMTILTKSLSMHENSELMDSVGAYVSPHRSEGLGLTVIEAMQAGKLVISTRYGGVADFVTESTAFIVPHELVEVGSGADPYPPGAVWAAPSAAHLRTQMRHAFQYPKDREQIARNGKELVDFLFDANQCTKEIGNHIFRIWEAAA